MPLSVTDFFVVVSGGDGMVGQHGVRRQEPRERMPRRGCEGLKSLGYGSQKLAAR